MMSGSQDQAHLGIITESSAQARLLKVVGLSVHHGLKIVQNAYSGAPVEMNTIRISGIGAQDSAF